jgi:hypothetical protein
MVKKFLLLPARTSSRKIGAAIENLRGHQFSHFAVQPRCQLDRSGAGRDLLVSRHIHNVYLYALPLLIAGQALALYLWLGAPSWWLKLTDAILS